jgi:phage-related protein
VINETSHPRLATIAWEGDSREVLQAFPEAIRQNFGFELWQLQQGEMPELPATSFGWAGRRWLRDRMRGPWYQVVYLSRIRDVVYAQERV